MTTRKQQVRAEFRKAVFARDLYRCVTCGFQSIPERVEEELDAHHITPRELMPGGGYVVGNGVSLCRRTCHHIAELELKREPVLAPPKSDYFRKYTAAGLYEAIGSSYAKAFEASTWLPQASGHGQS